MSNKIKVINKGYTITVTSWENDGDYYQTNTMTVQTEEEARKIAKLCNELFISCNNGEGGIGNTCDDEDEEANETIDNYIENNMIDKSIYGIWFKDKNRKKWYINDYFPNDNEPKNSITHLYT